ncbi:MAG: ABC transporter ATP-binding protein [Erysipelothrix sp.]|nr:ABC transporter ATP-binding protein [Erysipelothrix sp.]
MPEIILKNVTKKFGDFVAVDNLSMTIKDGDFITLLGPSGCGKTTTLRMIAGLETPTEGDILIDGKVVFSAEHGVNVTPDKRNVGFLFQNYALWPHMTVYQNISFGLENMKWNKDRIKARVQEIVEMLEIEQFQERYPNELSGGQQQRVAIARTLAPGPKVLFMDEPLSNLDAKLRMDMRTELKRLHVETGSTFVYVTHDQLEAMTLSTKICLLKEGVLNQYEPPLDIYNRPINTFVADFVGNPTMNFIDAKATNVNFDEIKVEFNGVNTLFQPSDGQVTLSENQEVILGVRPEYIKISEKGSLVGKIYSTLPSGLETVVKVDFEGLILTVVVFGDVDFIVDEELRFDFTGDRCILFDKDTKEFITQGSLTVVT